MSILCMVIDIVLQVVPTALQHKGVASLYGFLFIDGYR